MQDRFKVLQSAERYVAGRQYGKAIQVYEKLLKSGGDDPGLLNTLGDLLLKNNRQKEAISHFHRVVEIYVESGFVAKAIAVCKKIFDLEPGNERIAEKLVDLYVRKGVSFEASGFISGVVNRYQDLGELGKAVAWQGRALELTKSNPAVLTRLAELQSLSGLTQEACESFLKAARLFLSKGKDSLALDAVGHALEIDPSSTEGRELRRKIRGDEREVEEASIIASVLPQEKPESDAPEAKVAPRVDDDEFALDDIAWDLPAPGADEEAPVEQEEVGESIEALEFEDVEKSDVADLLEFVPPEDEESSMGLSGEITDANQFPAPDSAGPEMSKAEADELEDRLQEVDFYTKLDLNDEARQILSNLQVQYPQDERVRQRAEQLGIGPSLPADQGDLTPEGDVFGSEVEFALDSLFEEESEAPAEDALTYAVPSGTESDDHSPRARYDLGLAYREMGMFQDAAEKFEESFDLSQIEGDKESSVLAASMLASTYLQLTDYRKVVEWSEKGLEISQGEGVESKSLEYDRSRGLEMLGDLAESLEGYRRIFELDPEFRDVQARIARLDLLSS
ncbi:MAG: tetratricopeptide repeat protein [Acidobacteriota bacterium]|nr:MAG: tetratricopeptide repeat protein [Acidobacteriota bacterium]